MMLQVTKILSPACRPVKTGIDKRTKWQKFSRSVRWHILCRLSICPQNRDPGAGIGEKNRVERILMSF
jgi:hypothetical protein